MCGIFGIYKHPGATTKDLRPLVERLLSGVEQRGKDACGLAYCLPGKNTLYYDKDPITPSEYVKSGRVESVVDPTFTMLIGHSRHATQGPPSDNRNNHPLISTDPPFVYAFVHNGMVYTTYTGKRKLQAEVDTEVIRATVSDILVTGTAKTETSNFEDAIHDGVEQLSGSMTTVWITPVSPDMYFTRKGNPLCMAHLAGEGLTVFASTREILTEALDDFFPSILTVFRCYSLWEPPDNELIVLQANTVRRRKMTPAVTVGKESAWWEYGWDPETKTYRSQFHTPKEGKKKPSIRPGKKVVSRTKIKIAPGAIVSVPGMNGTYIARYTGIEGCRTFLDGTGKEVVLSGQMEVLVSAEECAHHLFAIGNRVAFKDKSGVFYIGDIEYFSKRHNHARVVLMFRDGEGEFEGKKAVNIDIQELHWFPYYAEARAYKTRKQQETQQESNDYDLWVHHKYGPVLVSDKWVFTVNAVQIPLTKKIGKHMDFIMASRTRRQRRFVHGDLVLWFAQDGSPWTGRFQERINTRVLVESAFRHGKRVDPEIQNMPAHDVIYFPSDADIEDYYMALGPKVPSRETIMSDEWTLE